MVELEQLSIKPLDLGESIEEQMERFDAACEKSLAEEQGLVCGGCRKLGTAEPAEQDRPGSGMRICAYWDAAVDPGEEACLAAFEPVEVGSEV